MIRFFTPAAALRLCRPLLIGAAIALVPTPAPAEPFLIAQTEEPRPLPDDVIDAAAETGQFRIFLAAVESAGMSETLRGEGPFTIFAPTDAAFQEMNQSELDWLMQPAQHEELIRFVSYHIVPDLVTHGAIEGRRIAIDNAAGDRLQLDARDGLRVNDQLVVMPDVVAANGAVQGVNAILRAPIAVASR